MTEACQAYKQALPQCISSDSGLVERATFFAGSCSSGLLAAHKVLLAT